MRHFIAAKPGAVYLTVPRIPAAPHTEKFDPVQAVVFAQQLLVCAYSARGNTPTKDTIRKAKEMYLK